jgi:hypothetical protein
MLLPSAILGRDPPNFASPVVGEATMAGLFFEIGPHFFPSGWPWATSLSSLPPMHSWDCKHIIMFTFVPAGTSILPGMQ